MVAGKVLGMVVIGQVESWWSQHWSEVAAVVLSVGFLVLVGTAVRSSLFLGQTAVSKRAKRRSSAAASSEEQWVVTVMNLERRIADLEGRAAPSLSQSSGVIATISSAEETLQDRIERLAREGVSTAEIARVVGEPVGRVELILNLRRAARG